MAARCTSGGRSNIGWAATFNNAVGTPAVNFGTGNTADYVTGLGSEPKGNVYGTNALINFAPLSKFSGTTSQRFSTATGPYGALQVGNSREPIPAQTGETFFTGNLTQPLQQLVWRFHYTGGVQCELCARSHRPCRWVGRMTRHPRLPRRIRSCNVGNNPGSIYCATGQFNEQALPIGARATDCARQVHDVRVDERCYYGYEYRDDERVFELWRLFEQLQHSDHECMAYDGGRGIYGSH